MADSPIYIVHLSSVGALKTAMAAKQSGQSVFVETCPHYLYFNIHDLERPSFEGAKFVMSPPLRPPDYQEVLWSAVINGGIDVIATDHGTFKFKGQKDLGKDSFAKIPNGIPGVEERALAIYQGGVVERNMSLNRFVDLLSATPARIFGLYPRKGTIAVGADADLLIFDPSARGTLNMDKLHYNSDYCPYEGMEITGGIERVFVRGKPVIEVGNLVGQAGSGQFIQRSKFSL
jgi:dihydropyrimidinase